MGNGTEGFGFGVTLSWYDVRDGVAVTKFRAEVDIGTPGIRRRCTGIPQHSSADIWITPSMTEA